MSQDTSLIATVFNRLQRYKLGVWSQEHFVLRLQWHLRCGCHSFGIRLLQNPVVRHKQKDDRQGDSNADHRGENVGKDQESNQDGRHNAQHHRNRRVRHGNKQQLGHILRQSDDPNKSGNTGH